MHSHLRTYKLYCINHSRDPPLHMHNASISHHYRFIDWMSVPDRPLYKVQLDDVVQHSNFGFTYDSGDKWDFCMHYMAVVLPKLIYDSVLTWTFLICGNCYCQKSKQSLLLLSIYWPIFALPACSFNDFEVNCFCCIFLSFTAMLSAALLDLLSSKQSGFHPGYSTLDVLLHMSQSDW